MEWSGALRLAPTPALMHQARRTLPRTVNCNAQGQSHARAAAAAAASAPAYTEAAVAPPLGQPSSPDAEHSQARNDDIPLGTADLEAFCQQRGISAALVPALGGKPPPPGCVEVKSLLFLVNNHPLVAVLPLAARVDEKRIAELLHTGRNQVRMAPAGSLAQLCGYEVGTVPPFGHRRRLPVLVDTSVTAYATCYAGGGSGEVEIFLTVPELLRASAATVADIAKPRGAAGAADDATATRQQAAAAATAALPLPWQPGQQQVELCGVIAHRRKIAKLLMFANLVPLGVAGLGGFDGSGDQAGQVTPELAPPPAAHGTAAFLRRLWRHPATGAPCEVQLIMGKTLERRLGSEAAAELLRGIRTGQHVRVTGRVQEHLRQADGQPRGRSDICDVVVSDIQTIEPAAPAHSQAGAAESSSGAGCNSRGSLGLAAASKGTVSGSAAATSPPSPGLAARGCYNLPGEVEQKVVLVDCDQGLDMLQEALFGGTAEEAAAGSGEVAAAPSSSSSSGSEGSPPRGFGGGSNGGGGLASLDGGSEGYRLVVGLDCEWQPYERGQPKSQVSLLQLATPDAVFLLDMLALCNISGSAASCEQGDSLQGDSSNSRGGGADAPFSNNVSGDGSKADAGDGNGHSAQASPPMPPERQQGLEEPAAPAARQLPPLQRRLSWLLARLFGDARIVKAGFGMGTDLQRLCESYPALPCFGGEGPVPLRSHVDVLLLARTALGGRMPPTRRCMSLSSLAEAVLGVPLDKSEQCSDWGSRPLTQQQLRYAAADAHAVVAMYLRLQRLRPGLDTPFWVAAFSGRLTDVADFHPSKRGLPGLASTAGHAPVRRSSGSAGHLLAAARRPGRASQAGDAGGGGRAGGQTLLLDANVDYLLQTYLGRQLPQGGKAAAVRAAAAFTGRGESGRTPSFPRGCGGLLEWRNAFLLFVNVPERDEPAAAGRRYPNEFLWLPPRAEAAATLGAAGSGLAAGQAAGAAATTAPGGGQAAAAGHAMQQEVPQAPQAAQRLGMTWWPGRGQTLEHPVIQRLLAAGGRAAAGAAAPTRAFTVVQQDVADTAAAPEPCPSAAADDTAEAEEAREQEGSQQAAVLLFCRAGGQPYTFCGRLLPAAVADPPASAACLGGKPSSCVTWELADAQALLAEGSHAAQLLLTALRVGG